MKSKEIYKINQQLRRQKYFSAIMALSLVVMFIYGTTGIFNSEKTLEVERLDIVEKDGSLALSLSNSDYSRAPEIDSQPIEFAQDRNSPAILFYDGKGDEVGGLLLSNKEDKNGHSATRHLSFDGYKQDQTLTLRHIDQNGRIMTGLEVKDRPEISLLEAIEKSNIEPDNDPNSAQEKLTELQQKDEARFNELWGAPTRLFVGKNFQESSVMNLHDAEGVPRLQLEVSADGKAAINFFNEKGEVIDSVVPKK